MVIEVVASHYCYTTQAKTNQTVLLCGRPGGGFGGPGAGFGARGGGLGGPGGGFTW